MKKKLVLVDGNSMIYKAYFATSYTGKIMTSPTGVPTNAVYAMANMLNKVLKDRKPDHMLVAFDKGKKTVRHEYLEDYKAGRSETPQELRVQFPLVKQLVDLMGIKYYEIDGYEADDIIGTLARSAEKDGYTVEIFSSDNDLLQLVDNNTTVFLTHKGLTDLEAMNADKVFEKWGVWPNQIPDLKGLMGDSSDNIKGIPGIGHKTAVKLITEYGSVESIIENVESLKGAVQTKVRENSQMGIISKKTATIICDSPISITVDNTELGQEKDEELINFYSELGIKSLVVKKQQKTTFKTSEKFEVVTKFDFNKLITPSAINVEVFDDNYNASFIIGYSIYNENGGYYISIEDAKNDNLFLAWLKNEDAKKIVFNNAKVINSSKWEGIEINGIDFDIQIGAYINNHKSKMDICSLENHYLNTNEIWGDDTIYGTATSKKVPELEVISSHSTLKAKKIMEISSELSKALNSTETKELFNLEMQLSNVLASMEYSGVSINSEILEQIGEKAKQKLMEAEKEIFALCGKEFNVASPKQLAEVLFDDLKLTENKKRSTAVDILIKLFDEHPVIKHILIHRKYSKLLSTYVNGISEYISSDGKIHCIYNQTLTETGRLSSKYPNLQNISIRDDDQREIRKAFVASQGCTLVAADYSQVELRVLASLADIKPMKEAFEKGIDIHTLTASKIFNTDTDKITSDQRRKAKAVNFGIIYGLSDFGLAEQLIIPVWEAKEIINNYLNAYPEIEMYREQVIQEAKENGYVQTMLNRKRFIPEINDKMHMVREFGKRAAMNAPIQGSAADIIKIAMVNIFKEFSKLGLRSKMIMQIHDELVFDVLENELDTVERIITEKMENAVKLQVPLKVNVSSGKNLFDTK